MSDSLPLRRYCLWVLLQTVFLAAFLVPRLKHFPVVQTEGVTEQDEVSNALKLLYIVTSMAEFDNGHRNTRLGRDRFQETLLPVVSEAVHSMLSSGYQVDVYLITHYKLSPLRQLILRDSLPEKVGLQIWDDATPLGYAQPGGATNGQNTNMIKPITRALSRQHRYIIKDKFRHYDLFVNFEDDMLIKGDHVDHFLGMTNELRRLAKQAPVRRADSNSHDKPIDRYHGNLTKIQLARLVPGFIRVEVIENKREFQKGRKENSMSFPQSQSLTGSIDAATCCHRNPSFWNQTSTTDSIGNPTTTIFKKETTVDDIYLWETQTIALGLHKMPLHSTLDWVVLQRGIDQNWIPKEKVIGEYWTGQTVQDIPIERPNPTLPQTINNQGGWIGTAEQIFAWHRGHCKGEFLPPFGDRDGLKNNVEYWSGGLNLVGMNACQLQRIVSLDPVDFSKHLVYHTSNNKQRSKHLVFTNIQTFWEQLHSVRLKAQWDIIVSKA